MHDIVFVYKKEGGSKGQDWIWIIQIQTIVVRITLDGLWHWEACSTYLSKTWYEGIYDDFLFLPNVTIGFILSLFYNMLSLP